MRHLLMLLTVAGLILVGSQLPFAASSAAAGEEGARALVDRAITALGGADKLAQLKAYSYKAKGIMDLGPSVATFKGEWVVALPSRYRMSLQQRNVGRVSSMVFAVDGDEGWIDLGMPVELAKEQVEVQQLQSYSYWIAQVAPLQDKSFKLELLGEKKVDGQEAHAIKVTKMGRPDVTLFLDKQTGLPAKTELIFTPPGAKKEMRQDYLVSEFKKLNGVLMPMRFKIRQDGKLYINAEITSYTFIDKLDASLFTRPKS